MQTTIDYVCPACKSGLTISGAAVGKQVTCPQCGMKSVVPKQSVAKADEGFDFRPMEREQPRRVPREGEPWYFAMASFYAWLLVLAGFIVLTLVPGFMLILASRNSEGWALSIVFFTFVCYCLPIALALFFSAALIFLFVDVARSLRAIRRQER
jgi:DNA-directed RNA polymerase subunit RPC12/RpoP